MALHAFHKPFQETDSINGAMMTNKRSFVDCCPLWTYDPGPVVSGKIPSPQVLLQGNLISAPPHSCPSTRMTNVVNKKLPTVANCYQGSIDRLCTPNADPPVPPPSANPHIPPSAARSPDPSCLPSGLVCASKLGTVTKTGCTPQRKPRQNTVHVRNIIKDNPGKLLEAGSLLACQEMEGNLFEKDLEVDYCFVVDKVGAITKQEQTMNEVVGFLVQIYSFLCFSTLWSNKNGDAVKEYAYSVYHFLEALQQNSKHASNGLSVDNSKLFVCSSITPMTSLVSLINAYRYGARFISEINSSSAIPEVLLFEMGQGKFVEGLLSSRMSKHQNRSRTKKYHQLQDSFPHTADPPIAHAVPVFENKAFYKSISVSKQANFENSPLDQFVRATAIIAQQVILEAYKQTIYTAIARAYITRTALQIYHISYLLTFFHSQNTPQSFQKTIMEDSFNNPEFDAILWEIYSPTGSVSPETTSIGQFTPHSDQSPEMMLFEQFNPLNSSFSTGDMFPALRQEDALLSEFIEPSLYNSLPSSDHDFEALTSTVTAVEGPISSNMQPAVTESSSTGSSPIDTPVSPASPQGLLNCMFPNCNKGGFRRECDRTKHQKTHEKNYLCKYKELGCKSSFSSSKDKARHEETVHEKSRKYQCPYCPERKSRRDNLKDHMFRIHKIPKR